MRVAGLERSELPQPGGGLVNVPFGHAHRGHFGPVDAPGEAQPDLLLQLRVELLQERLNLLPRRVRLQLALLRRSGPSTLPWASSGVGGVVSGDEDLQGGARDGVGGHEHPHGLARARGELHRHQLARHAARRQLEPHPLDRAPRGRACRSWGGSFGRFFFRRRRCRRLASWAPRGRRLACPSLKCGGARVRGHHHLSVAVVLVTDDLGRGRRGRA
mmetsp:Transcript_40417/g.90725  ORF Transcript_40417/g.90725 Transcript_40417/m.90725 type:complete len:216 (-) Transcript_40417:83-730(-)